VSVLPSLQCTAGHVQLRLHRSGNPFGKPFLLRWLLWWFLFELQPLNRRWILAISFVAIGIALAFLIYTLVPKESPPPSLPENMVSALPAGLLTEGGGVFYTDYSLLRQTFSPTATGSEALVQFGQVSSPYDLGSSLFRIFWLPDLAEKLKLDWSTLEAVAWSPLIPLEIAKGSFDAPTLDRALINSGYTARLVGTTTYYDSTPSAESELASLGQVVLQPPYMVMEHFYTGPDLKVHREEVLMGLQGEGSRIVDSETWKALAANLQDLPSFFIGPAPVAPGVEALAALDPNSGEIPSTPSVQARAKLLLGPDFLDFAAFPDLNQKGKLTFLLRYKDEASAQADLAKIEPAMADSYSAVFRGETFLTLLGKPQVTVEKNLLRVVVQANTGVKMIQAMVQGGDFGFLYKVVAE